MAREKNYYTGRKFVRYNRQFRKAKACDDQEIRLELSSSRWTLSTAAGVRDLEILSIQKKVLEISIQLPVRKRRTIILVQKKKGQEKMAEWHSIISDRVEETRGCIGFS